MNTLNEVLDNYGKKVLRRNEYGRWIETIVNSTYVPLILEFPEDYRSIN